MTKRESIETVGQGFSVEGYTLLSTTYKNCAEKLLVRCPNDHEYLASWAKFKTGRRCPKCVGKHRRTLDEVREFFANKGYELTSQNFLHTKQHLDYRCDKGHLNKTTVNKLTHGYGCPDCKPNKKKNYQEVYEYFNSFNYQLITPEDEYKGSQNKVSCRCPRGHEYQVPPASFYRGNRCNTCVMQDNTGPNNPNWKADKVWLQRLQDRSLPEYKQWRKAIYEKDKFTCQCCGDSKGGNLVAHHIINYSDDVSLAFEVGNGVTLCEPCHIDFHKTFGYTGNNLNQLLEYYDLKRNLLPSKSA